MDPMNQREATTGKKSIRCPTVEDFPEHLDLDAWCRDAVCITLRYGPNLKIYAVNPNDYCCYHLADFSFSGCPINRVYGCLSLLASCTLIGRRLYLLGRTDPNDHFKTMLWIWDLSEARKKKFEGEGYEWELGPALNSAKDKVLAFSLGGYLYALDIGRHFDPVAGTYEFDRRKKREEHSCDFECLQTNSNSEGTPGWVPLPPLHLEEYNEIGFVLEGHCCLQDSRFVLHMVCHGHLQHYLFCFDVTDNKWTSHRFSGLPLSTRIPDWIDQQPNSRGSILKHLSDQYYAQAQNHALIVDPLTGQLSVFDFSAVFDLLKNPDVIANHDYKYPYLTVEVDELRGLQYFDRLGRRDLLSMWQSYQLEDQRFCCLAFIYRNGYLYLWSCNIDLQEVDLNFFARDDVGNDGSEDPFSCPLDLQDPFPNDGSEDQPNFFARDGVAKIYRLGGACCTPPIKF